mmetsp:Transcript_10656/g.29200  ORF Transcript_10656/g.29200 Transcript_10656/m.29200 type:complete len:428 (-) Transcript_10656:72-1355(-)
MRCRLARTSDARCSSANCCCCGCGPCSVSCGCCCCCCCCCSSACAFESRRAFMREQLGSFQPRFSRAGCGVGLGRALFLEACSASRLRRPKQGAPTVTPWGSSRGLEASAPAMLLLRARPMALRGGCNSMNSSIGGTLGSSPGECALEVRSTLLKCIFRSLMLSLRARAASLCAWRLGPCKLLSGLSSVLSQTLLLLWNRPLLSSFPLSTGLAPWRSDITRLEGSTASPILPQGRGVLLAELDPLMLTGDVVSACAANTLPFWVLANTVGPSCLAGLPFWEGLLLAGLPLWEGLSTLMLSLGGLASLALGVSSASASKSTSSSKTRPSVKFLSALEERERPLKEGAAWLPQVLAVPVVAADVPAGVPKLISPTLLLLGLSTLEALPLTLSARLRLLQLALGGLRLALLPLGAVTPSPHPPCGPPDIL